MTAEPFTRDRIAELFGALSKELATRGQRAELFLVGGAAIALSVDASRTTRDLDAVFAPAHDVRAAADTVAEREGLPEGWLNDAADIALLYRILGLTTVNEGLDLLERAYPGRPMAAKAQFLLEEVVAGMA